MLASLFTSRVRYDKSAVESGSVLSAILRHLNTGTLALALFVAFAFLTTTRGKESEAGVSAHGRDTEPQLAITPCGTSIPVQQQVQHRKFTAKDFRNKVARNQ